MCNPSKHRGFPAGGLQAALSALLPCCTEGWLWCRDTKLLHLYQTHRKVTKTSRQHSNRLRKILTRAVILVAQRTIIKIVQLKLEP